VRFDQHVGPSSSALFSASSACCCWPQLQGNQAKNVFELQITRDDAACFGQYLERLLIVSFFHVCSEPTLHGLKRAPDVPRLLCGKPHAPFSRFPCIIAMAPKRIVNGVIIGNERYTALDDAGCFAIAIQIDQQPGAVKVTIRINGVRCNGFLISINGRWVSPADSLRRGDLREQIAIGGMPANDCVQQGSSLPGLLGPQQSDGNVVLVLPGVWLHVYDSLEPRYRLGIHLLLRE